MRFFASSLKFSDSLCSALLEFAQQQLLQLLQASVAKTGWASASRASSAGPNVCKAWILRWPIWSELEGVARRVRSALKKKPGQWTSDVSHLESAEFATIDIHAELLLRWWCMQNAKWPWTMRWLTTLTHKKKLSKKLHDCNVLSVVLSKLPGQFLSSIAVSFLAIRSH